MNIRCRKIDLSKEEIDDWTYRWCLRNNFISCRIADGANPEGMMHDALINGRNGKEGLIWMAYVWGKPKGWALAYRTVDGYPAKPVWRVHVYVQVRARRKGIGSFLLERVVEDLGPINVMPHDSKSFGFYRCHGLTKKENITGKNLNKSKIYG